MFPFTLDKTFDDFIYWSIHDTEPRDAGYYWQRANTQLDQESYNHPQQIFHGAAVDNVIVEDVYVTAFIEILDD